MEQFIPHHLWKVLTKSGARLGHDSGVSASSCRYRRKKFEIGPSTRPGYLAELALLRIHLEAYEYFNLYSWEIGFGIRYGRSHNYKSKSGPRKDVIYRTMQNIVYGCEGFPTKKNTSSIRCACGTFIRLLRSDDHGWYIKDCKLEHNHLLSRNIGEKLCWPSHKHIDRYTRELVRNLRQNNVPLTKVYIILGKYFGSTDDVPFNKRSLENFCKQLSKEEANDDGGVVLKTGWPIEKHAATIYTSAMLEMFSDHIFDSAAYNYIEVVPNKKYLTVHSDASRRQKWSKVHYEITISDDGGHYQCECGLAEHMGMLCCHAIRVMMRLGIDKVPDSHILKRWTKEASDVLPHHLAHLQKDRGSLRSQSYRHASLHVAALELATIGDKNIECYHQVIKYMSDGKDKFNEMCQHTDGRSLQEIIAQTELPSPAPADSGQLHVGVIAPGDFCMNNYICSDVPILSCNRLDYDKFMLMEYEFEADALRHMDAPNFVNLQEEVADNGMKLPSGNEPQRCTEGKDEEGTQLSDDGSSTERSTKVGAAERRKLE
ncbi:hypothetical protein BRADI_1g29030v3 [Brachypodium distachyon]|uniref:SWIM-type domain-containing protein n=1 Tax=Brachypodium distachyon TaxID=15368 RepID=I1GUX3_BRADI|nr:hypothetical protein BRADI_1g29030v3 [Brachypodium distachyon]